MDDKRESLRNARKLQRKLRRCQNVVEKETGISCSEAVTKNIAICNAGLSNGLSEELIHEEFAKYGPLQNIAMLPGKSCCFISFQKSVDAEKAFNSINGKLNIAQDNKPLYLAYTQTIPEITSPNFSTKPPGLIIFENFITKEEEEILLNLVKFDENNGEMKHRQVKHFGYEFRYDINNVDKNSPLPKKIPLECNFLWERLKEHQIYFDPDQLTVNRYKPGQGIPSHIDTHSAFKDPLVSLSLGSDVIMDFRHKDNLHHPVLLPRLSLTVISGESRYDWTHGITPRKFDIIPSNNGLTVNKRGIRISYTFRKVLKGKCDCKYKDRCDSYLENSKISENLAEKLESEHVHEVYEKIADHFSDTRHKPWPNVLEFVKSFEVGSILIDVGCGNGKYLGLNKKIYDVGCDTSFGLINVCKDRGFQVFNCNCLRVPLKDQVADGIISIAVIHHLATQERRVSSIKEITRLLRPNGRALIYVWAKDQTREDKSSYLKQDRKNRKQNSSALNENEEKMVDLSQDISLPVHKNRKQFQHQDVLVPWKLKKDNKIEDEFLRYYHVFEEGELESICKQFDNVHIERVYYDQGNWCIELKKC